MKRLGHLYEKLIDIDYLVYSIKKAFKKKKKTKSIKKILSDPRKHAKRISKMIQNGELPNIKERNIKLICDDKQHKYRTITKASNYEHIVHHAVIGLLEERIQNSSYRYAVASFPKRGDLFGQRKMRSWIKSYRGRKLYVLKFDIKKFFDTIDRQILLTKLSRIVKDEKFMFLLKRLVYFDGSYTNRGVPIGYYSSQWLANFYLQSLDNFIKQDLRIRHMMRYADDVVILSQNKRYLRKVFSLIKDFLSTELALTIKSNYQLFKLSYKPTKLMIEDGWNVKHRYGRPIDFMGYKFYPWSVTIRKITLRSTRRSALRFNKNRTIKHAKSLMSYYGRLKHTDTKKYYNNYLKPIITFTSLRRFLSSKPKLNKKSLLALN